ncbi:uncharacterized protein LOC135942332 [Cloeon dipterum]|uniref:uncharacterized protein LOC135942332 n=1 Tax=Cloeon dipterum TaxID=197152 RepID=UPI0032207B5A
MSFEVTDFGFPGGANENLNNQEDGEVLRLKNDNAALQQRIAMMEQQLLNLNSQQRDAYKTLKVQILKNFSPTVGQTVQQFLKGESIRAKELPTAFLARLRSMCSKLNLPNVSDALLKGIFLKGLPSDAQSKIYHLENLDEAATMLDSAREWSLMGHELSVHAIAKTAPVEKESDITNVLKELQKSNALIMEELIELRRSRNRSPTPRGTDRERRRSSSRSRQHKNGVCWYHYRFGDRAFQCNSPCLLENHPLATPPEIESTNAKGKQ